MPLHAPIAKTEIQTNATCFGVPVNEIGKTVFLTREEADRALEAMKDE